MSSKPCYETLTLVSRCLKPKSFSKGPTSCKSQQIWLYSSQGSYLSKVKLWTSAITTSAKNIGTFIRHSLEPIDILKKNCDFKKLTWIKVESGLPNVNEISYCLAGWARTTECLQNYTSKQLNGSLKMFKTQNSEYSELKLKWPNQSNRFMNKWVNRKSNWKTIKI